MREEFNKYQGKMSISTITLMELIYGVEKSATQKKMTMAEAFSARLTVLDYDALSAGQLHVEQAKLGKQILAITVHARSLGLL